MRDSLKSEALMYATSVSQSNILRLSNWGLLRSLCMLAVVVVHCGSYLGPLVGIDAGRIASSAAILCDLIIFALSGYFGIRPLKTSLSKYYSHKVSTIILPLVVYSIVLYLYTTGLSGASIHGYIAYFSDVLTPWWFIPTLIPFLLIAPFLYWLFEKLSEHQAKNSRNSRVRPHRLRLHLLCSYLGPSELRARDARPRRRHPPALCPRGHDSRVGVLYVFLPRLFRSTVASRTSDATRKKLIVIGLCAWVIDVACSYFGVDSFDPSFPWLFATIAVLFMFDRIRITNISVQRALEWTGRRSYSIYLLQYTAIAIVAPFAYDTLLVGGIGGFIAPIRLLVWVGVVAGSYAPSLAVASLIDATLLKLVQAGYDGVAKWALRRFEGVER